MMGGMTRVIGAHSPVRSLGKSQTKVSRLPASSCNRVGSPSFCHRQEDGLPNHASRDQECEDVIVEGIWVLILNVGGLLLHLDSRKTFWASVLSQLSQVLRVGETRKGAPFIYSSKSFVLMSHYHLRLHHGNNWPLNRASFHTFQVPVSHKGGVCG